MTVTTTGSSWRARLRALSAGALLCLLVVGIPVALLVAAPVTLPTSLSSDDLGALLAGPDDGTVLRSSLVLIAWAAWCCVAASVAVEVVAVLRRRPTPQLPFLAVPQRAAAALVAAVVVGLSPAAVGGSVLGQDTPERPVLAAAASHAPLAQSTSWSAGRDGAPTGHHEPDESDGHAHGVGLQGPSITVRPHDTLWALAERHLGSGLRYREIVALNEGREQADGRRLTDPHWIYPGWDLLLPPDATGPGVRRWHPEHRAAPDPAALPRATRPPDPSPAPPASLTVDRGPLAGAAAAATGSPTPDSVDRGPVAVPGAPQSVGEDRATRSQPVVTSAAGLSGTWETTSTTAPLVAMGLGAITVAGVLAEVSRQRRTQQRSRRPGERIAMPRHAVQSERLLRSVASPAPLRRVQDGLALLVDGCRSQGRDVPRVALVRARAERLELELATDPAAGPPAPFVALGPRTWCWTGEERPLPDPDRASPCPALISVGTDGTDLVLVNLEAAGALRVHADRVAATSVLSAVTVDLTSRARSGAVTVAVAQDEQEPGLPAPPGMEVVTPSAAADRVVAHASDVAEVLRSDGAADVAEARSRGIAQDAWVPQVVVGEDLVADAAPWSGSHVVSAVRGPGWTLTPEADGRWRLDPMAVRVDPARLGVSDRGPVIDLLRQAARPVPAERPERSELLVRVAKGLRGHAVPKAASDPSTTTVPYLRVLGTVEVRGADDSLIPGRVRRATELVAYLALHPGVGRHQLDEVMWPGQRVARTTRNPFVSRARQWLGRTADGRAYLPLVADEGEYRLLPEVGCDWYDFVRSALAALQAPVPDLPGLLAALGLVGGRPFQGIDPTSYSWADPDIQDMVSAVVDVAHVVAELQLDAGDAQGAARSAARGLSAEPCSELLHQDAIRAAAARGDRTEVGRAVARMRSALEALDLDEDLLPETVELLEGLRAADIV